MSANIVEVPMKVGSKKINFFNQLPDEMLIQTFSELQANDLINLTKVCRRFGNVVNYEPLWRTSTLTAHRLKRCDFDKIIQFPIKELELSVRHICPIRIATDEIIESHSFINLDKLLLFKTCPRSCQYILNRCKPKHLILKGVELHSWLLISLSDNKELEVFSMRDVSFSGSYVSLYLEITKFEACTNLQELDLGNSNLRILQFSDLLNCSPKSVKRFILNHIQFIDNYNEWVPIGTIIGNRRNMRLLGVSMACLKEYSNMQRLAQLEFLDTLRLCYREKDVVLSVFRNILLHLRQVRKIQFTIGDDDDVSEDSKEELKRELNKVEIEQRNNIDLDVQYMTVSICNGARHYDGDEE